MDPLDNLKLPLPSKETYQSYPTEAKLDTLFDLVCVMLSNQQQVIQNATTQRKINHTLSAFFGLIGGFLAFLGERLFRS